MKKIALISHGCAKNLVDSELILGLLSKNGYEVTLDENESDIVIVNTCAFINDADEESVHSILEMINNCKKVIVAGCLAQKHKEELKEAIPEISAMIGPSDINKIVEIINDITGKTDKYIDDVSEKPQYIYPENVERQQITVGASSYIKIADGCNYRCAYCVIPYLRGDYKSRPIEKIVEEAKKLVKKGVTEIVLIAQDTTYYGVDLYGSQKLPELLEELNKIEELGWIRIMNAYPTQMTDRLLDTIAKLDKVVKYVDIPLQHSDIKMLELMNRPAFDYRKLVDNIRKHVPDIAIRTAFIVGFPTETDEQFEHLYDFVKEMKFNKMGVFQYSREKGTPSYKLKPLVKKSVMKERYDKLMELQQGISLEVNKSLVGKTLDCIIESFTDNGMVIARSQYDAPEVDGVVYIKTDKPVVPGDIEKVKITDCYEYDLIGEIIE